MALRVPHLQVLLDHWGNAPCMVARVPLDLTPSWGPSPPHGGSSPPHGGPSPPRGRRHGHSSSSCHSQTLRSQAHRYFGGSDFHHRHLPSSTLGGWGIGVSTPSASKGSEWPTRDTIDWPNSSKAFPRLALDISLVRVVENIEEVVAYDEGWTLPDDASDSTDIWGPKNDKYPPSPPTGIALAT